MSANRVPQRREILDCYAEGSQTREEEFEAWEENRLFAIAERLEKWVYLSEPGPVISWNAVLNELGFTTPHSRVAFSERNND